MDAQAGLCLYCSQTPEDSVLTSRLICIWLKQMSSLTLILPKYFCLDNVVCCLCSNALQNNFTMEANTINHIIIGLYCLQRLPKCKSRWKCREQFWLMVGEKWMGLVPFTHIPLPISHHYLFCPENIICFLCLLYFSFSWKQALCTLIRLLPKEQFDLGPYCLHYRLPKYIHI